jgi:hypothetical protein
MQFGPDTPRPGLRDNGRELASERRRLGIEALTEAGGKDRGAAGAGGGAALERIDDAGRRHQHDHMVGRLRQCLEIGIAGLAPDLAPARIDQIDRPGEFVAVEIVPDARGPAPRPVAGADQNDVARRGERRDLLLGRVEIHSAPCMFLFRPVDAV